MLKQWISERQYQRRLKQFQHSRLAEFYTPPHVGDKQTVAQSEFFVLDFETTGLNPKTDRLLSMGWTTIKDGRIQLGKSEHYFIQHTDMIPDETVAIHHITEQEAANGMPLLDIFPYLLQQMSGKVLVAHFADIEVGFLQQVSKKCYDASLPLLTVDTLQIAFQMKYKDAVHVPSNALNLFNLREQYQLPRYKAHNAMQDAIATAELLLVQSEQRGGIPQLKIRQLLS